MIRTVISRIEVNIDFNSHKFVCEYLFRKPFSLDSMLKLVTALGCKIISCRLSATALQMESDVIGPMPLSDCNLIMTKIVTVELIASPKKYI